MSEGRVWRELFLYRDKFSGALHFSPEPVKDADQYEFFNHVIEHGALEAAQAEIARQKRRADGHWETLKSILKMDDLEQVKLWVRDSASGYIKDNETTLFEVQKENQKLKSQLDVAVKTLGKISQLEEMPLDDNTTVLKKHNVMASFSREALTKIKELESDEKEGEG